MYYLRKEPYINPENGYSMPNDISVYKLITKTKYNYVTLNPTGTPDTEHVKLFKFNSILEALNVRDSIHADWIGLFDIYDENDNKVGIYFKNKGE